ncbi:hypothetical protein FOJ82_12880 [Tessaracoccus rhinocerotis]|uniref:Methionine synthase n=1 Tax=Tessaracoccus rhinocerotis TaxID=1689449 RepID=A0A553JYA4_9ACTN|nr:hypothetical protein [Tessaracoccus rhinocerotis]TRY17423.1 hypothetical protein FOJ82_12880 [Tessaracoccus rhinocerotis]
MRVTAAGSLPGDDFRGALSAIAEVLPEILPLPELPARGSSSGMVGRALGLVDGLGFDLQPAGWRLVPGSSPEHRRAAAQWRNDLDDTEELLQGFDGVLKVGVAGPWTLAGSVERPRGDRLLADHGARRELAEALAEGTGDLLAELRRRVPAATVLLQLDEPLLVAVADGSLPTASGFSRHRAVDGPELAAALRPLADGALLHCCAPGDWLPTAGAAGFAGAAIDTRLFTSTAALDRLGEWLEAGHQLVAGVVDTTRSEVQGADALVTEALRILRPLELDPESLTHRLVLGTGCGLAGLQLRDVVPQLEALRAAAPLLEEQLAR